MVLAFHSVTSAIERAIESIENIALLLATDANDISPPYIEDELECKNALDDCFYAFESMALGSSQISKDEIR